MGPIRCGSSYSDLAKNIIGIQGREEEGIYVRSFPVTSLRNILKQKRLGNTGDLLFFFLFNFFAYLHLSSQLGLSELEL